MNPRAAYNTIMLQFRDEHGDGSDEGLDDGHYDQTCEVCKALATIRSALESAQGARMLELPDRCPKCKISWTLFPPVNHDDTVLLEDGCQIFAPTNGYRCVECKTAYRVPLAAAAPPAPSAEPMTEAELREVLARSVEDRESAKRWVRAGLIRNGANPEIFATTALAALTEVSRIGGVVVTDEMVARFRERERSVASITSNAIGPGTVLATQWYYEDQTFTSMDAAKEAQQTHRVRAALHSALGQGKG